LPTPKIYGPPEGKMLLVGWGSTQGPIKEAVDRARAAGDSVSGAAHQVSQSAAPGLENIFAGFNHIFVVEMNDEGLYGFGQLGGLLRARYCDPKIRGINKTDGLTWKVKEILDRVKTTSPSLANKRNRTHHFALTTMSQILPEAPKSPHRSHCDSRRTRR
jgi:2-oxoglutarate ferredoxin oxidoreductase subunit alpha